MEKVERIERLISNVRKPARLSIERAKLYTELMKRTEGEPTIIRQAKALKHVLENIPIQILDGELIVGTMLPNPPGNSFSGGCWFETDKRSRYSPFEGYQQAER